MSELRDFMQQVYGGLREDRSTESYALEFLKTEMANRRYHSDLHSHRVDVIELLRARVRELEAK